MGQQLWRGKRTPDASAYDQKRAKAVCLALYKGASLKQYQNGNDRVPIAKPVSENMALVLLNIVSSCRTVFCRAKTTHLLVALNTIPFDQREGVSANRFGLQPFMVLEHHQV